MSQNRNELCSCGSEKKYKNCCMVQDNNSFFKKNRVTLFVAAFVLSFSYLFFDKFSNSEETIYCYECRAYFPISQAAQHKDEDGNPYNLTTK